MLDVLHQLGLGFLHLAQPANAAALVVGLVVGMLVAVLPGLTLVMGVVLALPFTYGMEITPSIVLLTAMYLSGTYGGAFTAILFRIPGEPLDVPLLWDGYAMARKGQAALALGWTLFAALWGGLITAVTAVGLAPPFAKFALRFDTHAKANEFCFAARPRPRVMRFAGELERLAAVHLLQACARGDEGDTLTIG